MFTWHYMKSDVINILKYSITHWNVTRRKMFKGFLFAKYMTMTVILRKHVFKIFRREQKLKILKRYVIVTDLCQWITTGGEHFQNNRLSLMGHHPACMWPQLNSFCRAGFATILYGVHASFRLFILRKLRSAHSAFYKFSLIQLTTVSVKSLQNAAE